MKAINLFQGVVVASLIVSFNMSCKESKSQAAIPEKYEVTNPEVMDTSVISEYVADIHSLKNVELRARVKGYLDKIHVDEGQKVKQGQVLFSISPQEYNQELLKAKANLKSALAEAKTTELDVQNAKSLVEKNVVSKTELDMAQSKLEAANAKIDEAKANIQSAELNLSFTEIKAPFDGIIDRIPNKVGSLIDEGTLLTTLSDNSAVFAYFNVSEQEYLNVSSKDKDNQKEVKLMLANNTEYPNSGKIETVESEIDKSTGNIAFRARFENPNQILKNGSSGKILLRKEIKGATLIPQKCVFEVQDKQFVYVVDNNHTVQIRTVTPQFRLANYYIIGSELKPNDQIIYEGLQTVKEGDKIFAETIPFNQVKKLLTQL